MKLKKENAKKIIEYNRSILYHLPKEYEYLNYYLQGSLRQTLLSIYRFISDKRVLIIDHQYMFFCSNRNLTYKVRRKTCGEATTSRHVNLLCAIGLINKQYQDKEKDILIDVNKNFFLKNPMAKRAINVYSFRRYDTKELNRMNKRAERLSKAKVTTSNFSQSMLSCHGLEDLADEALPNNDKRAPQRKQIEYNDLMYVLNYIVDAQGYTTRQELKDNLLIDDKELDRLFRIFRADIQAQFNFKRPTDEQIQKWQLKSKKYIYTRIYKDIKGD